MLNGMPRGFSMTSTRCVRVVSSKKWRLRKPSRGNGCHCIIEWIWEQVSIGHRNLGEFYRFFFAAELISWLVFWFVLKVVFSIGRWVLCFDFGMAFVDNWVVGKEMGCYWLSNDIVGLVGNLAM